MENCCVCLKSSAPLKCASCAQSVCKKCAQFLEESRMGLWDQRPSYLKESVFCYNCHSEKVAPALERYDQQIEDAKNLSVFFDNQGKETRFLSRKEKAVTVERMPDREEALLKLAFQAVLLGYNGLIDVSIDYEKVKNGGYQTHIYRGSGIPTQLPDRKLARS